MERQCRTLWQIATNKAFLDFRVDMLQPENYRKAKVQLVATDYGKQPTVTISHYMDLAAMESLVGMILGGGLPALLKHGYEEYKGTPADKANRADGKAESRVLKIEGGQTKPVIFRLRRGPGNMTDKGAVVPAGPAEEEIIVPTDEKGIYGLALRFSHYLAAWYNHNLDVINGSLLETYEAFDQARQTGGSGYESGQGWPAASTPPESKTAAGISGSRPETGNVRQMPRRPENQSVPQTGGGPSHTGAREGDTVCIRCHRPIPQEYLKRLQAAGIRLKFCSEHLPASFSQKMKVAQ